MFGFKGTLLASSAIYGLAALGAIAAPRQADAQSVVLTHGTVNTTFTTMGAAFNVMAQGDTVTVSPGPSATCSGTVPAGATSCVLTAASPFTAGQVVIFGSLNTATGVWGNGLSPSVPFRQKLTAVNGNTITWTQPAYQQAVNPPVVYDYDEFNVTFDWGGTLTCSVARQCHVMPTTTIGSGSGIVKIGKLGENPSPVVINGMDLEGGGVFENSTAHPTCYTPTSNGNGSPVEVGLTYCPGMIIPGGGDAIFSINGDNITISNDILAWSTNGFLADPPINGHGTISFETIVARFNGDNGGQAHNLYIGRFHDAIVNNIISDHSWSGNAVKCRAVHCTITGNTLGSSGIALGNGSVVADYTGNLFQLPDLGDATVTSNTLYAGAVQTNPNPVAFQGAVMPWPGSGMKFSSNTMTIDTTGNKVGEFIWNGEPYGTTVVGGTCQVDVRSNTFVTTGTGSAIPMILGYACQSGNVLNGTTQASGTITTPAIGVPRDPSLICDFSTGSQPCSIATAPYVISPNMPNDTTVFGDSHSISVTNTVTGVWNSQNVVFGSGGGTYNGGQAQLFDQSGTVPSIYNVTDGTPSSYFSSGDGDTITYNTTASNSGGYAEIGGKNFLVNECSLVGKNCHYLIEVKTSVAGGIPSGHIINNGGGLSKGILQISGGFVTISGAMSTLGGLYMNCSEDTIVCGSTYAVTVVDNTFLYKGVASAGTFATSAGPSGNRPGAYTGGGFPGFPSYTWNPTGDWSGGHLRDDTIWFGSGTGYTTDIGADPADILDVQGFIPGSGNATVTVNSLTRGLVELVNGYGGGTLTVSSCASACVSGIRLMQVGFSGAAFGSPVVVGSNTTIPAVDGTQIILKSYTGAVNFTQPVADSVTLTVPASQTIPANSTAAITGISVTDPNGTAFGTVNDWGDGGMVLLRENVSSGTIIPGGIFAQFATISADHKTLTSLAPYKMINDILGHQSVAVGAANVTLSVDYNNQFGYEHTTTENLVVTSSNSADMVLNAAGNITITPGQSLTIPISLSDPWASGQAGTLTAIVSDVSGSQIALNGTTYNPVTSITVHASYTTMVNALASLVYANNGAASDQIVAAVTNQGGYAQTVTVNVIANPAIDTSVIVPSGVTATAGQTLAMSGTLAPSISDQWAASNGQTITATEAVDFGTITLGGTAYPAGSTATVIGLVNDVNTLFAGQSYTAPLSGAANLTVTANNGNGGSDSETTIMSVIAQGVSTDLSLTLPTLFTAPLSGTISAAGGSINSPWSKTTPGPLTLSLHGTNTTILFGGTTLPPGQTLTYQDNVDGINTKLGAMQIVAAGTTNCDYIVASITNQAAVVRTGTITVNTVANTFNIVAPSAVSLPVNSSIALSPYSFVQTIPVSTTVTVTDANGGLVIGSDTYAAGDSHIYIGSPEQLASIFGQTSYVAGAVVGTDTITYRGTTTNGIVAIPATTTISITAGQTGTCPLP